MSKHLAALAIKLPLSSNFQHIPVPLAESIARLAAENPEAAAAISRQYSDEPWRQYVLLLQAKLPGGTAEPCYHFPRELDADLALLAESLVSAGAKRLADTAVWPVRRALDVFGFHLADLDIRHGRK